MPINERVIFDAAVEIADPKARQTFIEKACEGSAELKARVLALLKSHETAGSFLEISAVNPDGSLPDTRVDQTLLGPLTGSAPSPTEILKALTPTIGDAAIDQAGKATDDDDEENRVDLSFLQPSTKAGSIGTLGHYEILKVLGQGGFGVVFKAFDEKLHRHVAIKVMNPQMAATSPPRKRFLREARSAAAIRHDNIVAVHSVEEQPLPYLVMEFIDGQTLQQKLDGNGPLDVTEVLYLGQQIASGLAAAHALSLIHRDIKPGNILIEGDVEQKIKITDFGLARASDDASLTRSGMISGTPMYMAPEQAMGQPLDHRTDLFSVGSVLYQMACGRPPFRAPNTVAVLRRVAEDTPRALQEIVPELPDWLVVIINKLLAKKPEDRFQSAKEVAELLGRCRTELQISGKVTGGEVPFSGPELKSIDRENQRKESAKKQTRPSWGRIASSILIGVAMLLPIFFGKQISQVVSPLIWGPIPQLPVVERAAGLRFDGKDDFIQVPAQWDTPLLTIEVFVTPDGFAEGGTVLQLTNEKRAEAESLEFFDEPNQSQKAQSFAGAVGRDSHGTVAAPLNRAFRQHRVVTVDHQYMHYYVNGKWQGKRRVQPHDQSLWKLRQLTIGCKEDRTNFFTGVIDQLRISKVIRYTENFSPITSVSSDDATLALYDFDEGTGDVLTDSSRNGNDGRILGATWVHPARGLQFDGVDDYIDFEDLGWTSNQYTLETWITPLAEHGTLFQIAVPEGNLHAYLYSGGSGTGMNRDKPYTNVNGPRQGLKRQHLASVFDGRNLNYFINGKLVGSKTNISDLTTPWTLQRMRIGGKLDPDANKPEFFHGRMEQFRVSKSAKYVLPFTPEERLSAGEETLGLYNFDEGAGDVLKDSSGNGHDGKIVGAKWVNSKSADFTFNPSSPPAKMSDPKSQISNSSTGWHGWPSDAPAPAIAPFNAEQARQHQEAWAKYLNVPVEYTNSIGMKFRLIPPGEFMMGSTPEEIEEAQKILGENEYWRDLVKSEAPQHKVILTQPIYLGVNEVTQAVYEKVMGVNPSHFSPTGMGKELIAGLETAEHPVEMLKWHDAAEFCVKLSQQEKLKPFYFRAGETITPLDGNGYRLPTEAEWEYACRAGTTTKYWIDGNDIRRAGWFKNNSGDRTHAAGELEANPYGLCDTHGNVWEWVADRWDQTYYGVFQEEPAINPIGPNLAGSDSIVRGGSWYNYEHHAGTANRRHHFLPHSSEDVGFRVSLVVDAVRASLKLTSPAIPKSPAMELSNTSAASEISNSKSQISNSSTSWHGWPSDAPPPAIAPFNAEQARQHQEAWAKYLKVPVEYTNSIGMKFVLIPPGEFTMGSTAEEINELKSFNTDDPHWNECLKSEGPIRRITLSSAFYLGTYEVTQGEYQRVIGSNPSHFAKGAMGEPAIEGKETTMHPVETLSWSDAASFGEKLGALEKGKSSAPVGYRLPTEQEWEFACRAGTTSKFWSGDTPEDLNAVAWTQANSERRTHVVGQLKPNPFRLFDVHGNVWEWVQDRWGQNDYANQTPATISTPQAKPDSRVLRGGDIFGFAPGCRSSHRYSYSADHNWSNIGFRMALSVELVRDLLNVTGPMRADYSPSAEPLPNPLLAPEWLDCVSKLSPEEQVTEFTAEMKRRNPEWDGVVTPTIRNTTVISITFDSLRVRDLSPLIVFGSLEELHAMSSQISGELSDLSPLSQLKWLWLVHVGGCERIEDLSPLRNHTLKSLVIQNSNVSDLSSLVDQQLLVFDAMNCRQIKDLSPLAGAPLSDYLGLLHSGVTDLTPIQNSRIGMLSYNADRLESNWETIKNWPLRDIQCFDAIPAETLSKLQEIKTLEKIDNLPLEEYLKKP